MSTIAFEGRILFLSQDPDAVTRQLDGTDLELTDAQPLREDISTDEITPIPVLVHYDRELGRYALDAYLETKQIYVNLGG